MGSFGLQHAIHVAPDGGILSGARRWTGAKVLGWTTISVITPDIDFSDPATVQKYVLLANAYRKQLPSFVQKREADAYYRLLADGDVTKDELRASAQQRGAVRNDRPDNWDTPVSGGKRSRRQPPTSTSVTMRRSRSTYFSRTPIGSRRRPTCRSSKLMRTTACSVVAGSQRRNW